MGKHKGTVQSRHSSLRANGMQVEGISFPSHRLIQQVCPADLALVVPWPSILSHQWALPPSDSGLISTLQRVHPPGTGQGAADTVRDQKSHTNPASLDIPVGTKADESTCSKYISCW